MTAATTNRDRNGPRSPTTAPAASLRGDELRQVELVELVESPWNPRKSFDPARLAEMVESLKKGQLAPIIVRPRPGTWPSSTGKYEIGAGHRRFRAAPAAGMTSLLAIVRDLDDVAFLELLTIENKQRDDVAPLDEANGFKLLMEKAGYDVGKLAARIGLSTKYVYDRLKLLQLVPEAKKYLEDGTITAGHAILLARLTPADQKRVMGNPKMINRATFGAGSGLFEGEEADHDPDQPGLELKLPVKAVSVRELATFINDHVRFKPEENDLPNLFPAAAAALKEAESDDLDPVYITYDHSLKYEAKDRKVRTYGVMSWRRADGREKSKTCAWSRIGIVAAGRDRGDAFRVCVNRDRCEVHFKASARRKKSKAPASSSSSFGGGYSVQENIERKRQQEREDAERARWEKALPQLRAALAEKVRQAPTGPASPLGAAVLKNCRGWDWENGWAKNVMPLGRTAEDVVRRAGWLVLTGDLNKHRATGTVALFKDFGLDAQAIVDKVAPKPKAEKKPATKKPKKGSR